MLLYVTDSMLFRSATARVVRRCRSIVTQAVLQNLKAVALGRSFAQWHSRKGKQSVRCILQNPEACLWLHKDPEHLLAEMRPSLFEIFSFCTFNCTHNCLNQSDNCCYLSLQCVQSYVVLGCNGATNILKLRRFSALCVVVENLSCPLR